MGRHFEAVGILIVEDWRFFDWFYHNSFLLFLLCSCSIDAENYENVTFFLIALQKLCEVFDIVDDSSIKNIIMLR